MQIAAYIRVSTEEQADKGNSLSEQQERLNAYCKAMGWSLPAFYIDDGYSAKNLNRPAIQQLLEDVKQTKVNVVLTTKLDRLCRNLLDLLQTVELFNDHHCGYVSASESFDTSTAVGRMTLQLLGTFAEFERERISERVKDNMISLAKNTDKVLTRPCFGYDLVEGHYQINESEAEMVRFMFDLAEQGNGHRKIAQQLNLKGSPTKKGKPWDQINVKRLIKTETIAGIMVYNKRKTVKGKTVMRDKNEWIVKEDNHPAIIPPERWRKVQEIISSRILAHKHAENDSYLLTGLVKCKFCGGGMKGSTSRHKTKYNDYTYHRYICSSYVLGYGCRHHAVHRDDLENKIIEQIIGLTKLSVKNTKMNVSPSRTIEAEVKDIQAQLSKIDKRMQKQIEAYENDLISGADLKLARERVEMDRNTLKERLERLNTQTGDPIQVKQNAKKLLDDITGVDRIKAKNAIRLLIDCINVENDLISITWKV